MGHGDFVAEGLAGLHHRLRQVGYPIHGVVEVDTVPVDRRAPVEAVLERDGYLFALSGADFGSGTMTIEPQQGREAIALGQNTRGHAFGPQPSGRYRATCPRQ